MPEDEEEEDPEPLELPEDPEEEEESEPEEDPEPEEEESESEDEDPESEDEEEEVDGLLRLFFLRFSSSFLPGFPVSVSSSSSASMNRCLTYDNHRHSRAYGGTDK